MLPFSVKRLRFKQRLRFKLRTLAIVVLVLACAMAFVSRKYRRKQAVDTLMASGASVYYDERLHWSFMPRGCRKRWLKWIDQPSYVTFGGSIKQVGDAELAPITYLNKVRRVYLRRTNVTDGGLRYLRNLRVLREVDVTDTNVTLGGIETLKKALPNCRIVCVASRRDRSQFVENQR